MRLRFIGALRGSAVGLVILLPGYAVRIMGAGDVKLMAMCGAFLGLPQIIPAMLFAFVIARIASGRRGQPGRSDRAPEAPCANRPNQSWAFAYTAEAAIELLSSIPSSRRDPAMALRPTLTAAVLLSLAACASDPGGIQQAHCRAAGAEAVLGKTVNEQVIDQAIVGAGAMRSRVVKPGANVTMELDPLRINLEVDEGGRVRRLHCG